MSRNTITAPSRSPPSTTGAALPLISRIVPFAASNGASGITTLRRCSSTSSSGDVGCAGSPTRTSRHTWVPIASPDATPVRRSAAGLMNATRPARSTVITASLIERSVVENQRSRSRSWRSIAWRWIAISIALRSSADLTGFIR
jgi:hypothetical protein